MGEDRDQLPQTDAPLDGAPATAPGDETVAADPFASTLTVAAPGAPAGPRLEAGRELGPVRLLREIGRGATGTVFHGHHTVLGRDVAVKFLLHCTAAPGDADGLKRFVDEARAAAAVRHAHLTQIFHADVDCGTPYLVLEYVRGPTLRQLLDSAGPLGVPVAAAILSDVAAAVQELHLRGVIHRDIKPSNVLVDKDAHVFVTDFGLAVRRSHGQSADLDFAGTPAYMAPEMYEGRISQRSDVYAMGVMAFQLLAGCTPFSGTFHELRDKHVREPLPSDALRSHGVRPEVVEVIERATNKQAMFRYKTAPDFARALRDAAGCGIPELARARKQLCDLVAGRVARFDEAGTTVVGPGTGTAEHRLNYRGGEVVDDGSSLYVETISRIATLKRERRMHPGTEGEGSSSTLPPIAPLAAPAGPAARHAPPAGALGVPAPVEDDAPADGVVPAPALGLAVVAIVYGSTAIVWLAGQPVTGTNLRPYLPPATADHVGVYAWVVTAALASFALFATVVVAGAGCFRPRRWARRLMVRYAVADLMFQLVVFLVAVAWVGPVTVNAMATGAGGARLSPDERSSLETAVYLSWAMRWLTLSVFPAIALLVMTRRRVREAFEGGAPVVG